MFNFTNKNQSQADPKAPLSPLNVEGKEVATLVRRTESDTQKHMQLTQNLRHENKVTHWRGKNAAFYSPYFPLLNYPPSRITWRLPIVIKTNIIKKTTVSKRFLPTLNLKTELFQQRSKQRSILATQEPSHLVKTRNTTLLKPSNKSKE